MAQNDKPVHEIRLGKVKAAIWRNETESGTRYGVTFSRIYKTDEGWESSSSFGRDELPLLGKVADMAHIWIYQQEGFTHRSTFCHYLVLSGTMIRLPRCSG
ncbi:hypothetical protein SH467x_002296 [Pirellulaceae bacterium SH467]